MPCDLQKLLTVLVTRSSHLCNTEQSTHLTDPSISTKHSVLKTRRDHRDKALRTGPTTYTGGFSFTPRRPALLLNLQSQIFTAPQNGGFTSSNYLLSLPQHQASCLPAPSSLPLLAPWLPWQAGWAGQLYRIRATLQNPLSASLPLISNGISTT